MTEAERFNALIDEIMRRGAKPHELQQPAIRQELLRRYWAQYGAGRPAYEGKPSLGGMITGK